MATTTYSFADVSVIVTNPYFGQYVASGAGLGEIEIAMATDRTAHDVAADGAIMVSKIPGRNGTVTIHIQQTSDFQKWLLRLYNALETSVVAAWAATTIIVRSPMMQDLSTATGVSFQKLPNRQYQKQGQLNTWVLMAADIQQDVA